jgi:hypothetical protein
MIPHLIHIGLPKAGSTYLQHWFAAHPQLAYYPDGLGGFRDVNGLVVEAAAPPVGICWRVTSSEAFSAPRADAGSQLVDYDRSGRAPIAEEQARACRVLLGLFPGATILIVTRGFRSAILSGYSEFVRTGGSEMLADLLRGPVRDHPWNYDALVSLYRGAFGADRVIVLPFELLRDSPVRFLREIESRLRLDHFPFSSRPANVSASPVELAWYPRMTRAVREIAGAGGRVERLYGRLLYRGRLAPVARLLQRLAPQRPVTADVVDDAFLEQFRGNAELLRDEPLYQPYRTDYLL